MPLSLSVTRLPKLNLADAEALSYALILLIIFCHAAEKGGQIEKAPECYALMVAFRERGRERLGTLCGVGVSTTLCCPSQTFPLNGEKAENGLKASSETVLHMPKDNNPALDRQ